MQFSELGLCAPILRAAAEAGYTQPSPIQEKAIGPVLAGRDVLGCAQTGTVKRRPSPCPFWTGWPEAAQRVTSARWCLHPRASLPCR